jgi:hypothetical protein
MKPTQVAAMLWICSNEADLQKVPEPSRFARTHVCSFDTHSSTCFTFGTRCVMKCQTK